MEPVRASERIPAIDILRGIAVPGILLMNIAGLSLPDPAYWDPSGHGGDTGWDLRIFLLNNLFVEGTMRGLFSMLFGAGVLLFTRAERARDTGLGLAGAWYRRTIWLMVFGLVHAYLLVNPGEILFYYGIAGLLLYPARNAPARRLLLFSAFTFAVLTAIRISDYHEIRDLRESSREILERIGQGRGITPEESVRLGEWYEKLSVYKPDSASREQAVSRMQEGYLPAVRTMVPDAVYMQTAYLFHLGFLDALSMMLLGMALFRLQVLQGGRRTRFYLLLALLGYGTGVTLNWLETSAYVRSGFDLVTWFRTSQTYEAGRVATSLGHIGLVMLWIRSGVGKWLLSVLARTGRMALTNYIMQSAIALIVFVLFKQYGRWHRSDLFLLAVAVWILQLTFSYLWLGRFQHGPLEWAWRRLTYGRPFSNSR